MLPNFAFFCTDRATQGMQTPETLGIFIPTLLIVAFVWVWKNKLGRVHNNVLRITIKVVLVLGIIVCAVVAAGFAYISPCI